MGGGSFLPLANGFLLFDLLATGDFFPFIGGLGGFAPGLTIGGNGRAGFLAMGRDMLQSEKGP